MHRIGYISQMNIAAHGLLLYSLQSEDAVLSELEYRQFCICDIYEETADTNRYRFNLPFSKSLELKIGQHIIIRLVTPLFIFHAFCHLLKS